MGEKSGIHLTSVDSGWPVASDPEPGPKKPGDGTNGLPDATSCIAGTVTAANEMVNFEKRAEGDTESFTITFDGQTTSSLDDDATAADVETALVALSNIAPADIDVKGPAGGPWTLIFLEGGVYGDVISPVITTDGVGTTEVQTLTITGTPTGGTFVLAYEGQNTAAIAYNAAATAVRDALRALSNIGASDLTSGGGALPAVAVTITFTGVLAESNPPAITVESTAFTGGTAPAAAITTSTPGLTGPSIVVTTTAEGS